MSAKESLVIDRAKGSSDWQAVRRICCLSGAPGGNPIEEARWPFFGELWVGAYERFAPESAYVLSGPSGLLGYLLSALDTEAFEAKRQAHLAELWDRVSSGRFPETADTLAFARRITGAEPWPEESFAPATRALLARSYPAHLHMNLLAEARGSGWGGRLIGRLCDELREHGVPGVHLICGKGPVGFYQCQRFRLIEEAHTSGGVPLFAMGRVTAS